MVNAIEAVNGKILDAQTEVENYKNAIVQLYLAAFEREAQRYDNVISARTKAITALENEIALLEAQGYVASKKLYERQIANAEKNITTLEEKRVALVDKLNDGLANGVKKGSDEWYKMIDAINAVDTEIQQAKISVEQYKKAIADTYTELFNRAAKNNANLQSFSEMAVSAIQKQIEVNNSAGELSGRSYYEEAIEQTSKRQNQLIAERKELMKKMSDATKNGVKVGSDEWMSMVQSLNEVDSKIQDCTISINNFEDAILELDDATFERIQNKFSNLESELSNLASMFSGEDVATEDNKWTKSGLTQLGIAAQQYELASKRVSEYNDQIEKLNKDYEAGKYSVTQYTEKLAALKNEQWSSVKAADEAKKSIIELNKARVDIVIEGINKETEAYRKLIQAEKELLSQEKEQHDYEKQIADENKSIQDTQRQLAALAGDTSLAAAAKRAKLEAQLAEQQESLKETEYQHSIETQQEALDTQLTNYEEARDLEIETLQTSLENEELLLSESFARVKENTDIISQELLAKAQQLNIDMSTEIIAPWSAGEIAIAGYEQVLTEKTSAFMLQLGEVEQKERDLQVEADTASQKISDMFGNNSDALVEETGNAILQFEEEENAANKAGESVGKNFDKKATELVEEIEKVNEKLRDQERESDAAAQKIAGMFALRADNLCDQILAAWNDTKMLKDAADFAAGSLSNAIDGKYSGSSAVSALGSIKDAANGVKDAAEGAARALQSMASAAPLPESRPTRYRVTNANGNVVYDGTSLSAAQYQARWYTGSTINQYAKGIKKVSKDQLAWTQEDGQEAIIDPSTGGILTPLSKGSAVLPADQTRNIWEWSRFDPTEFASKLAQSINNVGTGKVQTNTMQVGSLITFNGPVNDTAEMIQIAAQQASSKIKQSFRELSNGLTG